jgi:hypothetical protein
LLLILRVFLGWENKKRDFEVEVPAAGNEKDHAEVTIDEDLIDREDRTLRYVLSFWRRLLICSSIKCVYETHC